MKVLIDDGRCQGHGRCWSTERQLFDRLHTQIQNGRDRPFRRIQRRPGEVRTLQRASDRAG